MSLAFPPEGASTNTLVAFCEHNDRNGNWPQHWTTIPAPWLESNTPRPSPEHVWYDWEGDCWMTDADLRDGLLETIARWKAESEDLVPPPGLPAAAQAQPAALTVDRMFTYGVVDAAMCLWEAILDLRNGVETPELFQLRAKYEGAVGLRAACLEWAERLDHDYEQARADGYDETFDWEFVPNWLDTQLKNGSLLHGRAQS